MTRFVQLWNGFPGVTPVKKFADRPTAIARVRAQALKQIALDRCEEHHIR
jgi:hypothetical protein